MEEEKPIVFLPRANKSIRAIFLYIFYQGSYENSSKFIFRLYDFIENIPKFPLKYPVCRQKSYSRKYLRCAVFEKHYIVVYKVYTTRIVIHNVVHTAKIRE
ncbi:MAG: type II toxin-antitoxin system RelE/ParE family toxin [Bacteroidales bacterium]|nr:type II toxin-antitoxin system RelE/ParE family toxin [Bacteroidales bacterium]MCF8336706.1 type II toxin-antitoxin system RelE/ParE family toxin [Bacteroidales bacterium]